MKPSRHTAEAGFAVTAFFFLFADPDIAQKASAEAVAHDLA
jgi:hypothetical protein